MEKADPRKLDLDPCESVARRNGGLGRATRILRHAIRRQDGPLSPCWRIHLKVFPFFFLILPKAAAPRELAQQVNSPVTLVYFASAQ